MKGSIFPLCRNMRDSRAEEMAQWIKNSSYKKGHPWNFCRQGVSLLILRETGDSWSKLGQQDMGLARDSISIYNVKKYQGRHLIATTGLQMHSPYLHTCKYTKGLYLTKRYPLDLLGLVFSTSGPPTLTPHLTSLVANLLLSSSNKYIL